MPPNTKTPSKPEIAPSSFGFPESPNEELASVIRNANGYLLISVGDLLYADAPEAQSDGGWSVPILLGNAWDGKLGRVGTLVVDSDGTVHRLTPAERLEVQNRARILASGSAS